MAIEGYVLSANVDTERRQPNANILPTLADDADDIPKHCPMYDGMKSRNETRTMIIEREMR